MIFLSNFQTDTCFFRVNIITDLLERNGETSAAAMLKRLTQLEEQVVA